MLKVLNNGFTTQKQKLEAKVRQMEDEIAFTIRPTKC